jgi:polar amino acid transport system substrate-binding protein
MITFFVILNISMKKIIQSLLFLLLIFSTVFVLASASVSADEAKQPIKLGTRNIVPFAFDKDGQKTGFSIELWKAIEKEANIQSVSTKTYDNVGALIEGVKSKDSDVAIAAISITSSREDSVDFSLPMFESGLGILTRVDASESGGNGIFRQIFDTVKTKDFRSLALVTAGLSLIPAIFMYFLERRKKDGFLDSSDVVKGIGQSYWWGITALAGQQERHPATKWGKSLAVMWMFFGVIFIAFFTAQITSNLTTQSLKGNINGLEDLRGKKIVTVKNSTAVNFLQDKGFGVNQVADFAAAAESLQRGTVDAVVYDNPILQYFEKNDGAGKVRTVGGLLNQESYGIAIEAGSPLRETINRALLKVKESGEYEALRLKWFGNN